MKTVVFRNKKNLAQNLKSQHVSIPKIPIFHPYSEIMDINFKQYALLMFRQRKKISQFKLYTFL